MVNEARHHARAAAQAERAAAGNSLTGARMPSGVISRT